MLHVLCKACGQDEAGKSHCSFCGKCVKDALMLCGLRAAICPGCIVGAVAQLAGAASTSVAKRAAAEPVTAPTPTDATFKDRGVGVRAEPLPPDFKFDGPTTIPADRPTPPAPKPRPSLAVVPR